MFNVVEDGCNFFAHVFQSSFPLFSLCVLFGVDNRTKNFEPAKMIDYLVIACVSLSTTLLHMRIISLTKQNHGYTKNIVTHNAGSYTRTKLLGIRTSFGSTYLGNILLEGRRGRRQAVGSPGGWYQRENRWSRVSSLSPRTTMLLILRRTADFIFDFARAYN